MPASFRTPIGRAVTAVLIVSILAAANILNNYVAVSAYVVTCLVATALLLLVHRLAGGTWEDVGLGRSYLSRGARWALVLIAVVAVGYLIAALLPATRTLFVDARVEPASPAAIAFQILVRIPLGTVLLEEVAFRGVLYGLVRRTRGVAWATAVSCGLFALWHVPPAVQLVSVDDTLTLGAPTVIAVMLALTGAAFAGLVLCELRRRSGSLLAPAGLHWATNALGYLTAVLVISGYGR